MTRESSIRRTGAVASAACLLVVGIGATTAQAAEPGATISAKPATTYIRQGEAMELSGSCAGLTATDFVVVTATLDDVEIPEESFFLDLDDNGAWSVESTVLDDATVGDWAFTAQCVDYNLSAVGSTASAGWTVLATLNGAIGDKTMAVSGQTTQISATGFAPGEKVEIYLDGELFASDFAAADGTILGEFTLAGHALGAHTLRLVGVETGGVVEIPFTVVEDPADEPAPTKPADTATPAAPNQSYKPAPAAASGTGLPRAASDVVL